MQRNTNKTALIYTRVSSAQQEADGTGHMSQAQRCAKWADELGYTVEMVGQMTKKLGAILEWLGMWWHRFGGNDNYK